MDEDEIAGWVETGKMTINEARTILGLPLYSFPQADELFVMTPTGPAFLEVG